MTFFFNVTTLNANLQNAQWSSLAHWNHVALTRVLDVEMYKMTDNSSTWWRSQCEKEQDWHTQKDRICHWIFDLWF